MPLEEDAEVALSPREPGPPPPLREGPEPAGPSARRRRAPAGVALHWAGLAAWPSEAHGAEGARGPRVARGREGASPEKGPLGTQMALVCSQGQQLCSKNAFN